jgi:transposase-like protein
MALKVDKKDNLFRVVSQDFSTDWVLDTPENRKAMIVFLRLLLDYKGKALYTHQELSEIVGSSNRQACSNHFESFIASGRDFLTFLNRKRKVNDSVVSAVLDELKKDPLAKISELKQNVNASLNRKDLSDMNIKAALEAISVKQIRDVITRQLSKGEAHYHEEYLLKEMMSSSEKDSGEKAGIAILPADGMKLSDPTAIRSLLTPGAPIESIGNPIKWVCFIMVLYYYGVPLSVLGRWFSVHKTTILRWVISLAVSLWPMVYVWINKKVKGKVVYIDEKWLKIKGKWHYWFVVLDKDTGLPLIYSLLAKKSKWSCQWIGEQLQKLKKIPRIIITDGMLGYDCLLDIDNRIKHILCHFHHQQGVTHYLKNHFEAEQIPKRKKAMKKVLQTEDKRTVKRRFVLLKKFAQKMGIEKWVSYTEKKLPKLLPSVGSKKIPKTNNAIERFFRAFNRFYKVRCGFFSQLSAKRELIFFMLMYLFIKQPETGKAPLQAIMPEVENMPFYKLVNDPITILMNNDIVNQEIKMADFSYKEVLLA